MQDMRPTSCAIRASKKLTVAVAVALLLASGTARAQLGSPTPGLSLGTPGTGSVVGGTGIPMGATELGGSGLSPAPLGVVPGTSPVVPNLPGTPLGLGSTSSMTPGTVPSLGSGLSPPVSPPSGFGPPAPTFGITNFGTGGVQALPGTPRSGSGGVDR